MAKYWKTAGGVYIKSGGVYCKTEVCPCEPMDPVVTNCDDFVALFEELEGVTWDASTSDGFTCGSATTVSSFGVTIVGTGGSKFIEFGSTDLSVSGARLRFHCLTTPSPGIAISVAQLSPRDPLATNNYRFYGRMGAATSVIIAPFPFNLYADLIKTWVFGPSVVSGHNPATGWTGAGCDTSSATSTLTFTPTVP